MGRYWYLQDAEVDFQIGVESPGAAALWISTGSTVPELVRGWERSFEGPEVGALLVEITRHALTSAVGESDGATLPAWFDGRLARVVLPSLQAAVVMAAAGEAGYDRVFAPSSDSSSAIGTAQDPA